MSASEQQAPAARRLGMGAKVFYGLGSVAFGVKDNGFSFLLLLFYNQVMGLPATLVGLALMIALLVDACIDPLIGQISDHLRSPWGRRHPFMYASALPIAVTYAALWNPPALDPGRLFLYLLALTILVRLFISLYEIPSGALSAEFSADYEERSILLAYRSLFGMLGGLTLATLTFAVLLAPDATHKVGQLNPAGYARYGLVAAGVMALAVIVSAAGTHRYIPTLMAPPPRRERSLREAFGEVRETLSNRSFAFLMLASIATAMAGGLSAALSTYFTTFFWSFSARDISYFTLGVFASAFIAFALTPLLTRRFGKRQIAVTAVILSGSLAVAPVALRLAGLMPPNGSPTLFAIIFVNSVLVYVFMVLGVTMAGSMIADVVENAELRTGRRSEGLFFAASTFVNKAVSGFGVLTASVVIDIIGLRAGQDPASVEPDTLQRLALVYCPLILGLHLLACLLIRGYAITRESHNETLRRLAAGAGAPRALPPAGPPRAPASAE